MLVKLNLQITNEWTSEALQLTAAN